MPTLPGMIISRFAFSRLRRVAVAGPAVLAVGGLLAACGSATPAASTTGATAAASTGTNASSSQQAPPGFGTEVTGTAAEKAKAAALAKYPGTAEKVMQLPD